MSKTIVKFLTIFIIGFLLTELIEYLLFDTFRVNSKFLTLSWFGLMIFYGFKYHIICCLVPAIWAGYKCRHKSCDHEYCHDKK
jgi:hypothetical protein